MRSVGEKSRLNPKFLVTTVNKSPLNILLTQLGIGVEVGTADAVSVGSGVEVGDLDGSEVNVGSTVGTGVNVGGLVGKSVRAGEVADSGKTLTVDSVSSNFSAVGDGASIVDT